MPSDYFLLILGYVFFNWNINQFYTWNLILCARSTYCLQTYLLSKATLLWFIWGTKRYANSKKEQRGWELMSIRSGSVLCSSLKKPTFSPQLQHYTHWKIWKPSLSSVQYTGSFVIGCAASNTLDDARIFFFFFPCQPRFSTADIFPRGFQTFEWKAVLIDNGFWASWNGSKNCLQFWCHFTSSTHPSLLFRKSCRMSPWSFACFRNQLILNSVYKNAKEF